jgi:hypothetical protein
MKQASLMSLGELASLIRIFRNRGWYYLSRFMMVPEDFEININGKYWSIIISLLVVVFLLGITGIKLASANTLEAGLFTDPSPVTTKTPSISPNHAPIPIIINFQPETAPKQYGHEQDYGKVYGRRHNGLYYGWNRDNQANARIRNEPFSPNIAYDTFNHFQKNGQFRWEIAVENGEYYVIVVGGDPSHQDSSIEIVVEGKVIASGLPSEENPWVTGSGFITITDGRLTLTSGEAANNNKINYIEITGLGFGSDFDSSTHSLYLPLVSHYQ